MKKLLFTIGLSLLGSVMFASHGFYGSYNSDLNIKMWDNSNFTITIDCEITERTRSFNLKNVSPGSHFVKIVKKRKNHYGHGFFVQTIYQGKINVPAKRKVFVKVEGRNKLSFKFRKKSHHNQYNNGRGNGHEHGHSHNNGSNYGSEGSCGNWDDDFYSSNGGHGDYEPVAMSKGAFNQLIHTIKKVSFDKIKLSVAKQALVNNNLSAKQVAIIMNQFSFENNKLNFAKHAYLKTVDKENYFIVNNSFAFSSSASELNDYIMYNA